MPIYAYKCAACGLAHDALQKVSDPPLSDCPACGAAALAKQVTAAGFQLKGSGWYVTDFREGGGKAKAEDKPAAGEPAATGGDAAAPAGAPKAGEAAAAPAPASSSPAPAAAPSPAPAAGKPQAAE